jgi:hypothetical protein
MVKYFDIFSKFLDKFKEKYTTANIFKLDAITKEAHCPFGDQIWPLIPQLYEQSSGV